MYHPCCTQCMKGLFDNSLFLALGTGWNVAKIDNFEEENFVEQIHLSAYDQRAY